LDRPPAALSGGQQQRVAIARALITRPVLILADEPTANLDSETGLHICSLLQAISREDNAAILFATHDPRIVGLAARVLELRDGSFAPPRCEAREHSQGAGAG